MTGRTKGNDQYFLIFFFFFTAVFVFLCTAATSTPFIINVNIQLAHRKDSEAQRQSSCGNKETKDEKQIMQLVLFVLCLVAALLIANYRLQLIQQVQKQNL